LNRHYARNPSCAIFVQHVGSDILPLGPPLHSLIVPRLDSQQQSSVNNGVPFIQSSNAPAVDDANVAAPLIRNHHEPVDMSFSFCFSDNVSDGSDDFFQFGIPRRDSRREQLDNLSSTSSPPPPMPDVSFAAAANLSDDAPLVTIGTGHFIFVPGDNSDEEDDTDSVQEEEGSGASLFSAGSMCNYLDNFALAESQFKEPLQNPENDPSFFYHCRLIPQWKQWVK
jgi:hypothetical protein